MESTCSLLITESTLHSRGSMMRQLNRSARTDADLVDVMIGLNLLSCVSRGPICQRFDYCFPKDKLLFPERQTNSRSAAINQLFNHYISILYPGLTHLYSTCKRPECAQMCSSTAFMVNWLSSTMPQITLQFCSNQPLTVNAQTMCV